MAASFVTYPGNGAQTDFTFPFPYLDRQDVTVTVNDVAVPFTFLNDAAIRTTTAPAGGTAVRIRRITLSTSGAVNFTDGSTLLERDLDLSALRATYIGEEATDAASQALVLSSAGNFTARNTRVVNLAAGVDPTDAVTKSQLDTAIGTSSVLAQSASDSAASALASKNAAKSSQDVVTATATQIGDLNTALTQATANAAAAAQSKTDADAAKVDAQAAVVDSLSGARVYTTVALGLAGTTNGQEFRVLQTFGEGHEVYRNNAGVALWLKARAGSDLAVAEILERYYPPVIAPVSAVFSHHTLIQNARGANNAARPNGKVMSRNLFGFPHGVRNQGSGPVTTPYGGDGPVLTGVATVIDFTTSAVIFSFWTSGYRPPAGTYTMRFRMTSNDANTYAMRYGASTPTPGYSTASAAPGVWVTCEKEFVTDGSNWSTFQLLGDGTNTPKVRIDEIQLYNDNAVNVPAFSTEVHGDDFVHPLAFPKARHISRSLDLTTSLVEGAGIFRVQGWPTVKHFSEVTVIAIAAMDAYQANQQLITTDTDTALGTTNTTLALTGAQADGAVDFTGITGFFDYDMVGQGFQAVGFRVKDGLRTGNIDTWEVGSAASAFTGFDARILRVGSNGSGTGWQNTFRWNGRIAAAKVIDRYLTDDQYAIEVETMKNKVRAAGIPLGDMPVVTILMGDSQTASMNGARGPSWGYLQADVGRHTPNMPVRGLAVAGYTTQGIVTDHLPVALRMIPQITRQTGRRPVVAMYIGTNNQQQLVDDWKDGNFTKSTGWWQGVRTTLIQPLLDAGARVVVGTLLPDGFSPPVDFEPARVAWNAVLKATAGIIVMDFASHPVMGDVANTTGTFFDTDHRHISTLGHVELAPYAATAIALAART